MTTFLGIDIGGTGSRWALVDTGGNERARGSAAGATGHLFADAPRAQFADTIAEIAEGVFGHGVVFVNAGITGLGSAASAPARDLIAAALQIDGSAIRVQDDVELGYRVLFAPGAGHLVAAGTGSVGVHIAADGEMVRVGGRGLLIDDAGSGTWIALRALDRIYRDIDTNGAPTHTGALAASVFDMIGGGDWDTVRSYVYGNDRGRIGELARAVACAADAGDPEAVAILARAGEELARLARALIARCGAAPVAVTGRVPDLSPVLRESLEKALGTDAEVRFEQIDQALGAARLALAAAHAPVPATGDRQ